MSKVVLVDDTFDKLNKASRRAALVSLLGFFIVVSAMLYAAFHLSKLDQEKQKLLIERETIKNEVAALHTQRDSLSVSVAMLAARANELRGTTKQLEELKNEATRAWEKVIPTEGWCYQESDQGNGFSVNCHWSQQRCNAAKRRSKSVTECALVNNLDQQDWKPNAKGTMDSWYQANLPNPMPPPFPQVWNKEQDGVVTSKEEPPSTAKGPSIPPPESPQFVRADQLQLIHKVNPNYPPLARQARIQGPVILKVVIGESGIVMDVELVSGHRVLAPSAEDAVKQWVYKPYEISGHATKVQTEVTCNFTLSGG